MTLLLEKDEFSCKKHMRSRSLKREGGRETGQKEESEVGLRKLGREMSGARAPSGSPQYD